METVLITGGTGMLGSALSRALLDKGYQVIILTREKDRKGGGGISYAYWDADNGIIDKAAIEISDYIVHLAGANLAGGRWTAKRKKIFTDSRVKTGELIVKAVKEIPNKIKAVISASAIGYYGPDPQIPNPDPFKENAVPDHSFLGTLVQQWEGAIQPVKASGKRLVILRFGIILSADGGAYDEFKKPLKFGLSTVLGNGKQVVSWIHIEDAVRLIIHCMENEKFKGAYNAVAPGPVNNKTLMKTIARYEAGRYISLPVPSLALKIALGEMSIEVLKSATVSSEKARNEGFEFRYPDIDSAIQKLAAS
ncbi:MAG TPA: TIGR01777 family oxidoreductase [Flavisolibacter sp.]